MNENEYRKRLFNDLQALNGTIEQAEDLLKGLKDNPFVYYVHSYRAEGYREEDLVGYSTYGSLKIPGLFRCGNIIGAQFHPEKSGEDGLNILRNFKELVL